MKFTRTLIALSAATLMATSAMAMEPAEYKAAKDQISADYKANKQKCDALQGNAKMQYGIPSAQGHTMQVKLAYHPRGDGFPGTCHVAIALQGQPYTVETTMEPIHQSHTLVGAVSGIGKSEV